MGGDGRECLCSGVSLPKTPSALPRKNLRHLEELGLHVSIIDFPNEGRSEPGNSVTIWERYVPSRLPGLTHSSTIAPLPSAGASNHGHFSVDRRISQGIHSWPRCRRDRDPRTATAGGGVQAVRQTPEVAPARSGLLSIAVSTVAELALRAGHRAARNGHPVASNGIQAVLEVEIEAGQTQTPMH